MDLGLVTAFLGGLLALLSPCGALLLPAFFAAITGKRSQLLLHGGVFYAGLAVTLVPLGIGVGALGQLFVQYRSQIVIVTALVLVVLGALQIFGFGFDAARLLPGGRDLTGRAQQASGYTKTFLLGASSGIAGFCAGPILGAILTLAAAQGNMATSALFLAVYGAGMVVPLMALAAVWNRLSAQQIKRLRGRVFTVAGRSFHSTNVITGVLLIVVGIFFYATNGLVRAPALLPYSVQMSLQSLLGVLSDPLVDVLLIVAVLIGLLGVLAYRKNRR